MQIVKEINAIATLAYRDVTKLLRDRLRLIVSFIFPIIFIGVLGTSLQENLGSNAGFNLLTFTFTGVLAQTLFQSTASGIISLIEDRENDFSQEMFVSPISRYSIIIGKIIGESIVSMIQAIGVIAFGLILGIPLSIGLIITFIPIAFILTFLGGAFGIFILGNLSSQRFANQIFPFVIFPQIFLAGVFAPMKTLPIYLLIPSRIIPLTYAVDLLRGLYYSGKEEYELIVLHHPLINLAVIAGMFIFYLLIGTYLFVRNERNR